MQKGGKKGREVRDERRGRREKDKDNDGECKNRGRKRNGEGGMPESNVLIQGLSSMESRACQIACNQQPLSLSDGGIVWKGSSALTLNGAFVLGVVVPLRSTKACRRKPTVPCQSISLTSFPCGCLPFYHPSLPSPLRKVWLFTFLSALRSFT